MFELSNTQPLSYILHLPDNKTMMIGMLRFFSMLIWPGVKALIWIGKMRRVMHTDLKYRKCVQQREHWKFCFNL